MVDSVLIKTKQFVVYSDKHFTKKKTQDISGRFGIVGRITTYFTEHSKESKEKGLYFPQVSILYSQRFIKGSKGRFTDEKYLQIQVSLPKLVYGVSLFEIDHRFLPVIALKLKASLEEIKVGVAVEDILNSIVHRVDYSKILKISPSYGSTSSIIHALSAHDSKQISDYNKVNRHGRKEGSYIKFFNSSQGFVIYDKFEEILANGSTLVEREIKKHYSQGGLKVGALRIELSLQLKQTVEANLRKFYPDKKKDFTLSEVVQTNISQTLLLKVFEQIYIRGYGGLVYLSDLKDTELHSLISERIRGYAQRGAIYMLAHRVQQLGLKRSLDELKKEVGKSSANRYRKLVESVLLDTGVSKNRVNIISYIHQKLKAFTLVLPEELDNILGSVARDDSKM